MTLFTQKFTRKSLDVTAVRVTENNIEKVAEWCQGEIKENTTPGAPNGRFIEVRVHAPKNPRHTQAYVGDWILYTDKGYKIYGTKAFYGTFERADQKPREFPYEEGDVVVIGPECFAQKDGSVLSWKGENYEPQGTRVELVRETVKQLAAEEQIVIVNTAQIFGDPHPSDPAAQTEAESVARQQDWAAETPQSAPGVEPEPEPAIRDLNEAKIESFGPVTGDPATDEGIGEILPGPPMPDPYQPSAAMTEAIETIEAEGGTVEAATPEALVDVIEENDQARQAAEAAAGRRVLTVAEQQTMSKEEVTELLRNGEAVLEQDFPQS